MNFEEKYIQGRKLGNGKFSVVYQCQNRNTGEIVAMKMIDKSKLNDREREFLREEIQISKIVRHPNIVLMRDSFESRDNQYIVMD